MESRQVIGSAASWATVQEEGAGGAEMGGRERGGGEGGLSVPRLLWAQPRASGPWVLCQLGQQESVLETDWGPLFGGEDLGAEVGRFELFPGQAPWLGTGRLTWQHCLFSLMEEEWK